MSSRVSFEFDVRGERLRTSCLVGSMDASHMLEGDVFGVLYEAGNPQNCTLVYQ